jgi:GntR family transcriptional regulator / MocR family aminotransferase
MKRTTFLEVLLSRRRAGVPLRAQLERDLRAAVQTGRLAPGNPLPSTRALAEDLRVSRGVVVEAYEQLLAEGYLTARQGSATRVASRPGGAQPPPEPEPAAARPRYDFRPGLPDLSHFPRRAWLASVRRALASAPVPALGYPDPRGAEPVRLALAAYLNRARGTLARPDRMVLCTGFAQGLRLVCRVLRERGVRAVAVEDPCHAEQRAAIRAMGLRPVPIPVDAGGLRVDRLRASRAGAVLVTPAHQFPTGAVLAPERRAALLDWAAREDAIVMEDDYDAEYRYDREPIGTLQGLAPERVVYAGSASKTLAPALRLGWLVPPARLAGGMAQAKRDEDLGSPALDHLAYADFLERGEVDRHLRRMRQIYRSRRDALVSALAEHLPGVRVQGVAAGLHLLAELAPGADEAAVVEAAAKRSVGAYGVRAHRARAADGPPALVLGYGGLNEDDIAEGVRRLAAAVHEGRARR